MRGGGGAAAAGVLLAALCGCGEPAKPVPAGAGQGMSAWAPGMTNVQARALLAVALEYFAERGTAVRVEDGWIIPQGEGEPVRYGLTNVAQACAQAPEEQWPELVAKHFDHVRASKGELDEWHERLKEWETAKRYLRLRLHHRDLRHPPELQALRRVDLPETQTVLVLDLPTSIFTVHEGQLAGWGKSAGEVWAAALANERAASIPTPEELSVGAGGPLLAFEAPDFFVASIALRPDQLPGEPPKHGWLLAVPSRDFALAYPVTGLGVMMAVNKLAPLVAKASAQGPGGVSRHLYWWDGSAYHLIRTTGEGEQTGVELSEDFTKLLNGLAAGK